MKGTTAKGKTDDRKIVKQNYEDTRAGKPTNPKDIGRKTESLEQLTGLGNLNARTMATPARRRTTRTIRDKHPNSTIEEKNLGVDDKQITSKKQEVRTGTLR